MNEVTIANRDTVALELAKLIDAVVVVSDQYPTGEFPKFDGKVTIPAARLAAFVDRVPDPVLEPEPETDKGRQLTNDRHPDGRKKKPWESRY